MAENPEIRIKQFVGECVVKAANTIISARVFDDSQTAPARQASPPFWFNLHVEELPSAQEVLQPWRSTTATPLLLDIYQLPWDPQGGVDGATFRESGGASTSTGTLLERWCFQWQPHARKPQNSRQEPGSVYKRLILLMRSLFTYVRILPAFRLYRACKRNRRATYKLGYQLRKGTFTEPGLAAFSAGSTGKLQRFDFAPVETPYGTFKMGVQHQPATAITVLEQATAPANSPHIIPDYVGRQVRREGAPMRSTLSASLRGAQPQDPMLIGGLVRVTGQPATPQGAVLLRRHSWSLNSGRAQSSGELPSPHASASAGSSNAQQGSLPRANPPGSVPSAGSGLLQQSRGSRGPSPSAFAPHTPSAAATPPKYPSGGLTARMHHAAAQAAAKLYSGTGRGMSPSSRGSSASSSSRGSAARHFGHPQGEEMRSLRGGPTGGSPQESPGAAEAAHRSSSQPVRIPGCQKERRLRSSGDLQGLTCEQGQKLAPQQSVLSRKTATSAPAITTMIGFTVATSDEAGGKRRQSPFEADARSIGGSQKLQQPDTPPVLQQLPSLGSESSTSFTSSYLASSSPQLPFAFTPTSQSHASAADPLRRDARVSGAVGRSPSNKEVASRALIRRPSWTNQLTSFEGEDRSAPEAVGYSVSPLLDSLDSSLFSSLTRQQGRPPFPLKSQAASPLAQPRGVSSRMAPSSVIPRLTYTVDALVADDEAELDSLPFALDRDPSLPSNSSLARPSALDVGASWTGPEAEPEAEADAVVGAFVRLIQEAPPLHHAAGETQTRPASSAMSVGAGLEQLARFRLHLSQMPASGAASAVQQPKAQSGSRS